MKRKSLKTKLITLCSMGALKSLSFEEALNTGLFEEPKLRQEYYEGANMCLYEPFDRDGNLEKIAQLTTLPKFVNMVHSVYFT